MIKRILAYAAAVLMTIFLFFLYLEKIIGIVLVMEGIYFFIAFVFVQYSVRKLEFSMNDVTATAEKNQEIPVQIRVKNKTKTLFIPFQIKIIVTNYFADEENKAIINEVVKAKESKIIETKFVSKDCGDIDIICVNYFVYDWLYIFKRKKKIYLAKKVEILPSCHMIMAEVTRGTREFIADSELYSDSEKGDDPLEIYQVREYAEGDSIHDIHWKLSAKSDELLVKEHGKPLGCVVLIWIDLWDDLVNKKKRKKGLGIRRRRSKHSNMPIAAIEMAASISLSLIEERCVHMVAWYEEKNERVIKKRIANEENVYELLNRMLYLDTYGSREKADFEFDEVFHKRDFSSVATVKLDGSVIVNGENIEIKKKNNKICWNEIYMSV